MRRTFSCLFVLAVASLATAGGAWATPAVKFKAKAVPIPGYPGTGNIYGAGSAIEVEYTITGTEYEGSPPPLSGINFYFPTGTTLHPAGFPTCAKSVLEPSGRGPHSCPKGSVAGPPGEVRGFVTLGGERVHENGTVESFYAPGGGVEFFTVGRSPVLLEVLSSGHYLHIGGGGGFGPEIETEIPLVASVPGAPYASVEYIRLKGGSAIGPKSHPTFYGRVPKKGKCPKAGFLVKTEVKFAGVGGLPEQEVTKEYRGPCPRR